MRKSTGGPESAADVVSDTSWSGTDPERLGLDFWAAPVRTSADGITVLDSDYRVVDANPAAYELPGYSLDRLLGQDGLTLLPEQERQTYRTFLDKPRSGQSEPRTAIAYRPDGSELEVQLTTTALSFESRRFFVVASRDATERHRRARQAAALAQIDALWARHGIAAQTITSDEPELAIDVKQALHRIAHEAVHNTVSAHALDTWTFIWRRMVARWSWRSQTTASASIPTRASPGTSAYARCASARGGRGLARSRQPLRSRHPNRSHRSIRPFPVPGRVLMAPSILWASGHGAGDQARALTVRAAIAPRASSAPLGPSSPLIGARRLTAWPSRAGRAAQPWSLTFPHSARQWRRRRRSRGGDMRTERRRPSASRGLPAATGHVRRARPRRPAPSQMVRLEGIEPPALRSGAARSVR